MLQIKTVLILVCSLSLSAYAEEVAASGQCEEPDDTALMQLHHGGRQMLRDSGAKRDEYAWPSGRGAVGSYGVSKFAGPSSIASTPTWNWTDPKGRWANIPQGTAIDDQKNVYLTLATGMRKFDSSGTMLWEYERTDPHEEINMAASILDGHVFCITSKARAFSLDMETGKETWSKTVGTVNDGNNGQVAAYNGTVITATNATDGHNMVVFGLEANNGDILWTFEPDAPVWNFAASFVGDGTFVFQDLEGRGYRNFVNNGSNIWKSGGVGGSWTDGGATVGPNGMVYTVSNYGRGPIGVITAYNLGDGSKVWSQNTSKPPNQVPVVGQVAGYPGYTVVLAGGQQCQIGEEVHIWAYDADTGGKRWSFVGPTLKGWFVPGDAEGSVQRVANGIRPMTMPNPWGQAAIDSNGIVFAPAQTGHFFSLQDTNKDGNIPLDDTSEVSTFKTGATFVGSSGPAIADRMLAVAAIDRLYVWQY